MRFKFSSRFPLKKVSIVRLNAAIAGQAAKRMGLKSHIRLSAVLVKSSSITLSEVPTHLRPA